MSKRRTFWWNGVGEDFNPIANLYAWSGIGIIFVVGDPQGSGTVTGRRRLQEGVFGMWDNGILVTEGDRLALARCWLVANALSHW